MAHVAVISATQEQIDIEFVTDELADQWCSLYAGQPYTLGQDPVFNLPAQPDQQRIDDRFDEIRKAYAEMTARGYLCDVGDMAFTYHCLNRWHRDFTTAEQHPPPGCEYDEWFAIINQINQSVHDLERFVHTPHRVWANSQFATHSDLLIWPVHTGYDRQGRWMDMVDLRDQCLGWPSDDPQAVYLNASIRGKSVLQAFLEHDSPLEDDVQGQWGTWGGLTIPQSRARLDLYESRPFREWCDLWGVDARLLPLEFCVGRVTRSSKPIDQFNLRDCRYAIDVVRY